MIDVEAIRGGGLAMVRSRETLPKQTLLPPRAVIGLEVNSDRFASISLSLPTPLHFTHTD